MTGRFDGALNLDGVRLEGKTETAYVARLSSRGVAEWAHALAPHQGHEGFDVSQIAVFDDRVLVTGTSGLYGPASRFVYSKSGAPVTQHALNHSGADFPLLVDAKGWLITESARDGTMRLIYRHEGGKGWQKETDSSHPVQPAISRDGRVAFLGRAHKAQGVADAPDPVSVLSTDSGAVLYAISVPAGRSTRVHDLGFDSKHRLWISGTSAHTFDEFQAGQEAIGDPSHDFILVIDTRGERVASLWLEGAGVKEAPVFLPDGRAVLGLMTGSRVEFRSSFAGSAAFGSDESLLEIDLERKQATRYPVPPNTSCLAPTADGRILGCIQHMIKKGVIRFPGRCDLVKWTLTPGPEGAMR
jgi:hypothetical protein